MTDRDHNCCSSIKQICNQSRREDERGGARHLTQFTFSFIFFFGGNSTADFFFFHYFSFDVYILSNLLGVFWGPECCQEESGETPPHFEGTGMIQRGSSGGRGSSGSSSLTWEISSRESTHYPSPLGIHLPTQKKTTVSPKSGNSHKVAEPSCKDLLSSGAPWFEFFKACLLLSDMS